MSAPDAAPEVARLDAAAAAWTVLSTAYGMLPAPDFVAAMRSPDQLEAWPYDDARSRSGRRLLIRSGTAGDGRAPEGLTEVVADHRRLFVGPRPLLAAPWESVHRSREGLVFEAETIRVRQAYRRHGLQSPNLNREPDDHIALEAAFVSALCLRALDDLERGDADAALEHVTAVADFVRDHLDRWLPDFLERIHDHARTDYHRGMADLADGALAHLRELAELRERAAVSGPAGLRERAAVNGPAGLRERAAAGERASSLREPGGTGRT